MKEEKEDSIDKLFSRGLNDPGENAPYREGDWDAMEAMLNGRKPKGIVRSLVLLAGAAAAMLLLVIGWLYLNPAQKTGTPPQVVKTKPQVQQDTGKYGPPAQQLAESKSNALSASDSSAMSANDISRKSRSFFTLSADAGGRNTAGKLGINDIYTARVIKPNRDTTPPDKTVSMAINTTKTDTLITPKTDKLANNSMKVDSAIAEKKPVLASVVDDIKPNKKQAAPASSAAFKPTFALSFVASPDINSVKGFSQNKVGTNAGLLLTMGVSKKWSITTGAIYADKPYLTDFANYSSAYKFTSNPASVSASCIVLDIPLNIGYQVYNKGGNKFSLGTGLSSYFMLRENYTFNYTGVYPGGPATYNIRNKNKHIMGILNLNMTYQREISSKFGVGVQPYYKLPLTGIGYGQVNLKSAGVAVGVTWNINSALKPK
ncbi:hypothetical protein EWM62_07455 [Mucilaginibacter terrigena]|uniref:Outer membrane protein beta-barrel domain-containing protein n=1 Tax=Mucilaginibacter terrigena TaxID=2492395 RepID=A0A4Q5LLG9_9SPHI|nr:hypothetical protein [Mucilaginibacter terrigena]RYU90486.1 hypothetical protein EWM62_07455 [Mucilaginibacter terrigena]